jgi:dephospho-CoA kinase
VVEPGEQALGEIADAFGPSVIAADGSLDRAALGAIVFSDPEARQRLNSITHPAVLKRSHELFAAAGDADPQAVVVYDIPLLVEAGRSEEFDVIVVVHASTETRVARMVELRGMTREEALHRINSQATDTDRFAIADVVIDADGTPEHTEQQADALWENLRARVGGAA